MRFALALTLFPVLAGCAHAEAPSGLGPGRYVETISSGGLQRRFIMDIPRSYDRITPVPVVVVLHGWTDSAALAERGTRMAEEGEAQGFVSVFPDGVNNAWNAGFIDLTGKRPNDVQFLSDLYDHLEKEIHLDPKREYLCGHSNGAFMTNFAGSKLAIRLAAIGVVAGTIGASGKQIPPPTGPVSAILIHGKKDEWVGYDSQSKALLLGIGAEKSAQWWAQEDGCAESPKTTTSPDGNVTTELFSGGKGGTEVELVSIRNGHHKWPGGYSPDRLGNEEQETETGVNAADLLWSFFKAHPKS